MSDLIEDSVRYLIHRSCQLPKPNHTDFSTITHFDILPRAARLGYQVVRLVQMRKLVNTNKRARNSKAFGK
ncbi:hypothetical protein [Paenibacillus polymyxa]|uniref:hypothetical protein n=1 Tax=Paenibacillus polymyxa TaxID=1406 RepID=UPI000A819A00|nr:hypothetical protein [Paenibacillus polymyxa]